MLSYSTKLPTRSAISIAVAATLAATAGPVSAQSADARFASYEDGFRVVGRLIGLDTYSAVHVGIERFDEVVDLAVANYCGDVSDCRLEEVRTTRVAGRPGKFSEYTDTKVIVGSEDSANKFILHPINIVRSCPDGAMLLDDNDNYKENRQLGTSSTPVACVPAPFVPSGADLGIPGEDGSNQCPVGNAATVGNPINPVTMSKLEYVVDYDDPSGSGLTFARTYHSGAASIYTHLDTAYPRDAEPSRMGARWRHSWDRWLVLRPHYDAQAKRYVDAAVLILEDGREVTFRRAGKAYQAMPGERGKLEDRSGGGWIYTHPDLTVETFDRRGQLVRRANANGQAFTLHYETVGSGGPKGLTRIQDPQGRELRIGYNKQGRINNLTTPDGGRIHYDHRDTVTNDDYDLLSAQYADGRRIQYLYDERDHTNKKDHKLTGIVGGDGKRFSTYSYDVFGRARRSSRGDDLEWTELRDSSDTSVSVTHKDKRQFELWKTSSIEGRTRLSSRAKSIRGLTRTRSFTYLESGLVGRQTDYLAVPTTYEYDEQRGLEVKRTEAAGTTVARTIVTTWHPAMDRPTRIDDGAHWTEFTYDDNGNLTERRDGGVSDAASPGSAVWPDERITRYAYDVAGRLASIDGPMIGTADTTRYAYYQSDAAGCAGGPSSCTWRNGDLHTVTNALGQATTVLAYDGAGRVLASTDANNVRIDRRYDAAGLPSEVAVRARRDGAPSAGDAITRMTYNANGDIETLTDPDGATLRYSYDAAHRLIERTDSLGNRELIGRDDQGLVGSETHLRADGTEDAHREYTYDTHGVLERLRDRDGFSISFLADANGRSTGEDGNTTKVALVRDQRGRVTRRTEGKSPLTAQTSFTYDGTDSIKTVVDPKGLSTGYLRNGLGDLLWQRSPDTGETAFANDEAGHAVSETPADGRTVDRKFDALGRMTTLTYSDGKQTRFTYDAAPSECGPTETFGVGRLATATDRDGGVTSFCYDFAGRVVAKKQVVRGVSLTLRYEYTPAGRLAATTYPDGSRVIYTRDAMGSIVDVTLQDGNVRPVVSAIHRDSLGRPVRWTAGMRTIERLYNLQGAVTHVSDGRADGLDLSITYADGNVKTITSHGESVSATHNALGQLTATGPTSSRHSYTYDKTGNRLSWTPSPSPVQTFEYPADSHRLIMAAGVLRGYDLNGNTTQIDERQFVYDASGRMSQAKVNGVVEMNYAYSPFGQQVARYIAGQTTVSLHDEAGHWLGDYDSAGRPIHQVVWLDDLPVAAIEGDAIRNIEADHIGSPRVVVDRATDKAVWNWSVTADAFGSNAPNEDVDGDGRKYVFDMRFPGQRHDSVTRLFQNGWRDYDPSSGRYIQSDPLGLDGGVATYSFVQNNPYTKIDPYGLASITVEAYVLLGGGLSLAWKDGTYEFTGRVGVGFGAGATVDPDGSPSPHAKQCGSGAIVRTSGSASVGAGLGPISAQAGASGASENVFDLSPKRHATDWGTRGYRSIQVPSIGIDKTNPTKASIRASASIGVDFGGYTNW